MGVLGAFRGLAAHLGAARDEPSEPTGQLRAALVLFVTYGATAHVCFCLTLLDVFGRADVDGRLATATRSPDGYLELLAEARRELAVSPRSARIVIDDVRQAWQSERVPAGAPSPVVVIPPPRPTPSTAAP
ncbi:hypothetical protein ACWD25_27660 [Streptomyces sp. NPDC002920]